MSISSEAQSALTSIAGRTFSSPNAGFNSIAGGLSSRRPGEVSPVSSPGPTGRRGVLKAMESRSDPLMNFNWYAEMPDLNPKFSADVTHLSWEFVEEASPPLPEMELMSNYRAGKNYHFPKQYNLGTLGLKMYEDSHGTSTAYLDTWQKCIFNPDTGLFYNPVDFKRPIKIWILDVAKLSVMCLVYTGCWPTRVEPIQLSSDQSARVIMGAEFSVDNLTIQFGKFSDSEIPSGMGAIGQDFPPRVTAVPSAFPSIFSTFNA